MNRLFNQRLADRQRSAGARPLITYYDERSHVRTELSASSFGNWVDKTAGLLTDEILIEPGQPVRLDLARTAPGHWVSSVWAAAIWRVGCPITVTGEAAVDVVGPELAEQPSTDGERVACSLHPLGLGFGTTLPAGTTDYGTEVRAQPDSFGGPWPAAEDRAWDDQGTGRTQADLLLAVDGSATEQRRLIIPSPGNDPWTTLVDTLLTPVLTGGSVVVVVGADPDRRDQIAATEQVDS
ncbi:TIGR03089 family protein [Microlunatus soli]|uniref:TIGR03089 family protein n=1 Tax=Microlunatus soli TaxID=630515 RepID=A0A1H1XGG1_9ACTN|nr:TIGR03089 family protein [Microlunatus soli]SDT08347.1 TIGR03089 family protein [Microlunatus soli]